MSIKILYHVSYKIEHIINVHPLPQKEKKKENHVRCLSSNDKILHINL